MRHIAPLPSLETLNKYLTYNPETGDLTWNAGLTYAKQRQPGRIAGTMSKGGYLRTSIERRMYANNRIAWKMHYGVDPVGVVDHEDGNKLNNRISNLRDTSQSHNLENRVVGRNSKTGFKGVVFEPNSNRYRINMKVNGVRMNFPSFKTAEEADAFARAKRAELHGKFACHSQREAA